MAHGADGILVLRGTLLEEMPGPPKVCKRMAQSHQIWPFFYILLGSRYSSIKDFWKLWDDLWLSRPKYPIFQGPPLLGSYDIRPQIFKNLAVPGFRAESLCPESRLWSGCWFRVPVWGLL